MMNGGMRKRAPTTNHLVPRVEENENSTDDDDEIDPSILKLYEEPLPTDGERGYSLPYNRRTLW